MAVIQKEQNLTDYLKLAQDAYDASSAYINGNWRADWDYSLRAFRNEHAQGSKYLSEEYKARSRVFRPKTRSIIRKNEAAGMQAMFSNRETVQIDPGNPDDVMSVAGAACMKEVLEYRLSKTIPTFEIYLGGVQDAQVTGTVVSYQYWEYEKRGGKKIKDQPCIELRPIENIRLDAGASWLDPVNTSPYFCDIIPMYVCDVRAMMENKDDKTGSPKWKKYKDDVIAQARPDIMDTTRRARLGKAQDPHLEQSAIKSFDVVWVLRWFMKDSQGYDKVFYTLGDQQLLSTPVDLEEVYFHGKRPYVLGYGILETHKALKTSMPVLVKPLQQETNDIANQRLDNVKFVLNKKIVVARGRQVDVSAIVRNAPGGVIMANDPKNDINELNYPDVTSSSFVEHDRLSAELDDLAGNFSPSTKVANNAVNDTLGGSKLAAAGAGLMTEYLLRTINETWWEKVVRQLVLLEGYYETDDIILGVCGKKAKLWERFGLSQITDDLLMKEVTVNVDASMGNPNERLQKFLMATNAALSVIAQAPPGANVGEMIKEIYSNAGYRDGERFFGNQDPRLGKAMQLIQQLQGQLQGKQMELQAGLQETQLKLQSNEKIKAAELQVDAGRIGGDLQIRQSETAIEQARLGLEQLIAELEAQGMGQEQRTRMMEAATGLQQAQLKIQDQRLKNHGTLLKLAQSLQPQEA